MINPIDDLRDGLKVRSGYWFAPKLFGFGATPVTWQGWVLTLGYAAMMLMIVRWLPLLIAKIVVGAVLTFTFVYLCWLKTDGGWHWHWGRRQ